MAGELKPKSLELMTLPRINLKKYLLILAGNQQETLSS